MKFSLKKAVISAVVVLAGVNLLMPVASVFAAPAAQLAPAASTSTSTPTSQATSTSTGTSTDTGATTTPTQNLSAPRCEGGVLGWILCPVIRMTQDFISQLEAWILNRLDMGPLQTTGRYANLYTAWAGFRDLANVFFIGIFLAIIFAQTLGMGLDNYSIKMMLPRIIIAAVAIQFSFFLMQIGVDISNVVGNGISGLFNTVIRAGSSGGAQVSRVQAYTTLTAIGLGGGLAAGAAITSGLIVPILLLILAAALSLLGVVITVWLRVLLIQILVLLAPLAIVAWVMPNTREWFKKWQNNLLKLLLMYPLIQFLISAGALATHISGVTAEDGNFAKILGSLIPILIFFMIPATIKASGSMMNFVGGFVMGHMNGASKRVRNSGIMKNAVQDFKERSALQITDNDKNLDRLDTFGKKRLAQVRRGAGRIGSGNALSFGTVGKRNIYKSTESARHALEEDYKTFFRENAFENPNLRDIALDGLNHEKQGKTEEITDRYGKKHKIKFSHHVAEAAISQLVNQSGFVELSDIVDGPKSDDGLTRDSTKGLFDHEVQQWRNKEIQATMSRAFGPNAGNVLKKITHAVHLQADRAYGAIGAADFAQLGAGSGIVAAREGREWGAVNMLNAMLNISGSSQLAGSIQNDVAAAMKRELLAAADSGEFDSIEITTRRGTYTAKQWLNEHVTDGGHVTAITGDIDRSGMDEALRREKEALEGKIAELEAKRKKFREEGPTPENH